MVEHGGNDDGRSGARKPPRVSTKPMWVLGLVIMVDQVDQNIVRGVVDQLKHDFGINDAAIGLLLSAFVLVNGLVTVPAGYLADRWHRTRTIGHTVIGWSFITMLTAAATNFATLLGLRAAAGLRPGDHRTRRPRACSPTTTRPINAGACSRTSR